MRSMPNKYVSTQSCEGNSSDLQMGHFHLGEAPLFICRYDRRSRHCGCMQASPRTGIVMAVKAATSRSFKTSDSTSISGSSVSEAAAAADDDDDAADPAELELMWLPADVDALSPDDDEVDDDDSDLTSSSSPRTNSTESGLLPDAAIGSLTPRSFSHRPLKPHKSAVATPRHLPPGRRLSSKAATRYSRAKLMSRHRSVTTCLMTPSMSRFLTIGTSTQCGFRSLPGCLTVTAFARSRQRPVMSINGADLSPGLGCGTPIA